MDMRLLNPEWTARTKIIRQLSPDVPIIALTAFAYDHDGTHSQNGLQRFPDQTFHI